jgi:hypothetical protein
MIRSLVALALLALLAPHAEAGQPDAPLIALWEFDGWASPTAERPLGLRFALLEDGRVLYAPDDPAMDRLIPNQYFQARLSPDEMQALTGVLTGILQQQSASPPENQHNLTIFYFRDAATGAMHQTAFAGHPCLARGRVFSATAPVAGLASVQNSADRAALPPAMREACNLLTGFHHASTEPWSPQALPAMMPER